MATDKNSQILLAIYKIATDFIRANQGWIPTGKTTLSGAIQALKYAQSDEFCKVSIDGCTMQFPLRMSPIILRNYENSIGQHTGLVLYRACQDADLEITTNKRFDTMYQYAKQNYLI